MKKDDIYHDPLLLRLGSFLYERKNIPEVVQNMRQIGRLMKIIRKKKEKKKTIFDRNANATELWKAHDGNEKAMFRR